MTEDEEFRKIFEDNELEEAMSHAHDFELTIGDMQEGLTDLCHITAFLASFLTDYHEAFRDGDIENAPKLEMKSLIQVINLFREAAAFLEVIEDDDED